MLHIRPPRHAFTLVELLVVIAVVALLVSILLPALAAARRSGRAAVCLSQIRQLQTASFQYALDHNDRFIDAALAHGGLGDPRSAWPVTLSTYIGDALVLRSPGDDSPFWPSSDPRGGSSAGLSFPAYLELWRTNPTSAPSAVALARWTSYGLNNYLTASKAPPPELMTRPSYSALSKVPSPASTVHFLTMTRGLSQPPSSFALADHVHAETWGDGEPGSAPRLADRQLDTALWAGRPGTPTALTNYGFADGHAAPLTFAQVYSDSQRNLFDPDAQRP